jgi:hypothetical protein
MADEKTLDREGKAAVRGPIRVSLPASIAYDPDRLKGTLGDILDQIGCRACCSGADIFLESERNFLVDRDSKISSGTGAFAELPRVSEGQHFTVGMSRTVKFDIDRVFQAVDKVIDLLGPHPCISGFDVLLKDELRTITINEQLEGQRFDQRF